MTDYYLQCVKIGNISAINWDRVQISKVSLSEKSQPYNKKRYTTANFWGLGIARHCIKTGSTSGKLQVGEQLRNVIWQGVIPKCSEIRNISAMEWDRVQISKNLILGTYQPFNKTGYTTTKFCDWEKPGELRRQGLHQQFFKIGNSSAK